MSNLAQLWQKEYTNKGIPSSFRNTHSGALNFLLDYLKTNKVSLKGKTVLDLGCGTGRNTFYLASQGTQKVFAVDFVQSLIDKISSANNPKIIAICHNLAKSWPIKNKSIDLIIDIFCFKHQATLKKQSFYKKELKRVLKSDGLLLVSLADVGDGYYGSLIKQKIKNGIFRITDPKTKVDSLLYTKKSLAKEFGKDFTLQAFQKSEKVGLMHDKKYKRATLWFIFKKK